MPSFPTPSRWLCVLMLVPAAAAQAQGTADEHRAAAYLAATCANCHGTDGRGTTGVLPALAGQPQDKLAAALRDFRDGRRAATLMPQLAKGYTDAQIDQLAAYFARQK